jgi:UDP-glucose 4-epimerase
VISLFIRRMARGERPAIHGDGSQTRDFTYVANVVAANLLAMGAAAPLGGEAYNVGTGGRISLLDLVATLNAVLGTGLEPEFLPPRAGDVAHSQASLDRIASALGYRPEIGFEEGLRRTVAAS